MFFSCDKRVLGFSNVRWKSPTPILLFGEEGMKDRVSQKVSLLSKIPWSGKRNFLQYQMKWYVAILNHPMASHKNLRQKFAKLLREVKFFINAGNSNFTYVKQDRERKFSHRFWLKNLDLYLCYCRLAFKKTLGLLF